MHLYGPIHLYGKNVKNFKRLLLWSLWANAAQISSGAFLGLGNKRLLKYLRSIHQYGHHAHIWWKSLKSSPELNKLWSLIFAQIIGDRRSNKIAKMMILCWRLTFLQQGQICFPMHWYWPYKCMGKQHYGKNVENSYFGHLLYRLWSSWVETWWGALGRLVDTKQLKLIGRSKIHDLENHFRHLFPNLWSIWAETCSG